MVEQCALSDPCTACFYARRTFERLVEWVYENDAQLQRTWGEPSLSQMMYAYEFRDLVGEQTLGRFQLIKNRGNEAVHRAEPMRVAASVLVASELFHVLRWLALTYGRNRETARAAGFDKALLPQPQQGTAAANQTREQLQELANQLAERDRQLREAREDNEVFRQELKHLRREISAQRKVNEADTAHQRPPG